jgi:hypothetical protein
LRDDIDPVRSATGSYTDIRQNEFERMSARGIQDQLNLLLREARALRDTAHDRAAAQRLSEGGGQSLSAGIEAQQPGIGVGTAVKVMAIRVEVAVHDDSDLHRAGGASRALSAAVGRHGRVGQQPGHQRGVDQITFE